VSEPVKRNRYTGWIWDVSEGIGDIVGAIVEAILDFEFFSHF
jgi:hypothetical protein